MTTKVYTVGHGARPLDIFLGLLRGADIGRLVDVRSFPGSRKHPHFGRDALARSLGEAGIAYESWRALGGFRRPRPESRHTALRSDGFRGYADHMETPEFRESLEELVRTSADVTTAVMCAESLWWRCHRRMLADAAWAAGCEVVHIMDGGRLEAHRPSPNVRVVDGYLVYDLEEGSGEQQVLEPVTDGETGTSAPPTRTPRAAR